MANIVSSDDPDYIALLEAMDDVQRLQSLATKYGIRDIFQDNGGKVLQALIILGLKQLGSREGNDARDSEGNEYELKTLNLSLGRSRGVTTHHHLNHVILEKYRTEVTAWYISFYENITLKEIWRVETKDMEPQFQSWERKIEERIAQGKSPDLNNPKIPQWFIRSNGRIVWPTVTEEQADLLPESSPLNPSDEEL